MLAPKACAKTCLEKSLQLLFVGELNPLLGYIWMEGEDRNERARAPFFFFWGGVDDHVRRSEMISYPLTAPFPNSLKLGEYERR